MSYRDLSLIKSNKELFPNLIKIIHKGENFSNFYSNSSPTESVMPSIFSSSLPLSYGTYQNGIINRPTPAIDKFIKKNYQINIFSNTGILSEMYGYDKKFNLYNFFSIEHIYRHFQKNYVWHFYNNKKYEYKKYKEIYKEIVIRFFKFFRNYIYEDKSTYSTKIYELSKINKNLKKSINLHLKIIDKDFDKYFDNDLFKILNNNFVSYFYKNTFKINLINKINFLLKDKNFNWKEGSANFYKYEFKFDNLLSPIGNVINQLMNNIDCKNRSLNFIHCMDLHHDTIGDNFIINKISHSNKKIACFMNIDKNIGKLCDFLTNRKIDYKLAISSDHGSVKFKGYGPLRNNFSEGLFYNKFIKIPFILFDSKRSVGKKNYNIYSSVDLISIIYRRLHSLSLNTNNHIVAEHCSRGSAIINLLNQIYYICIISKKYKLIYVNEISNFDMSFKSKGLYLFSNDDLLYKKPIKISKFRVPESMLKILEQRKKIIEKKMKSLKRNI